MQASNAPLKIPVPWALTGDKVVVPVPSQVAVTDGRASWTTGFVPLNATPLSAGGVAPFETDFNGVLYQMSAVQQWQCAGGYFKYDAAFSTAIGGYPKYAILQGATGIAYQSTVDNNITDPESGGTNWTAVLGNFSSFVGIFANTTLTAVSAGSLQIVNSPGVVVTLPAAASVRVGSTISVLPRNSCTVASADGIVVGVSSPVTSVSMGIGESGDFTSNGITWYATGGTLLIRPIGLAQTWQDLISSRAVNTNYTNTSGKPIMVIAGVTSATSNGTATITIDGATIGGSSYYTTGYPQASVAAIVPAGSVYRVSATVGTPTLITWHELR